MSEMNEIGEIKAIAARSGYKGELSKGALEDCVSVYKRHLTRDGEPSPRSYWMAANHKRSNLSEFQWLLTNTDNFKKWFGKSVVVDENGEPKVMFHGSWNAFREFRVEQIKLSKTAMTLWSGPGFYFSDNRKSAEIYAGGKNNSIYEVFLRIEKPLIVDETGSSESPITKAQAEKIFLDGDNTQWLDSGIASELAQMDAEAGTKGKGGKHYYKGLTRAKRVSEYVSRLKTDVVKLKTAAKAFGAKSQKKLLDSVCRHTGHDGVIHTIEPGVKEYVVYDPKAIKSANSNDGEFSLSKATVEDSAMKEVNDKTDAQGRNHAPAGSSNGGQFVSSGELRGAAHRVRNHVLKGNPELKGVPVDAYESEISRAVSGENKNVDSLISTLTNLRAALGDEHGLTKKVRENLNAVKGEDSAESTKALTKKENVMKYEDLIRALSSIGGSKEVAMDIVDRNGRHHEPKGIPPGGQFENEGAYQTTAKAKEEYYHKKFASTDSAKQMRDFCAGILSHIDSSKLGNDTIKHYYKQQIHKYSEMTKQSVLDGAHHAYQDMKTHARVYDSIKNMDKQEFTEWVAAHPEYNSQQMQNLLTNKSYNTAYKIKNDQGAYVPQDHVAWEEAKMLIARRATASMIDYMAHIEALNNTPEGLIDGYLGGKGNNDKHKGGAEAYENEYGVKHGEGEAAKGITMSEIQAVESEMSKAFEDAKSDTSKTAYAHAVSHFLGKDGGLRDPKATKEDVLKKAAKRIVDKEAALKSAQESGKKEDYELAANDFNATQSAAKMLIKALNVSEDDFKKLYDSVAHSNGEQITGGEGDDAQKVIENPPKNESFVAKTSAKIADADFKDVATKFLAKKMGKENPTDQEVESAVNELKGFLAKAQNGEFDNSPAGGGVSSNDNQFLDDIADAVGENHPLINAIREAAGIPAKEKAHPSKPKLTEAGKKFRDDIGTFLKSEGAKKYAHLAETFLPKEEKSALMELLGESSISDNKKMMEAFYKSAKDFHAKGENGQAKANLANYYLAAQHLHKQLSDLGKEDN